MKRLNVILPDELHKRLKVVCTMLETDMSDTIRRLIEEHIEKAEKKLKLKK